MSALHQLLVPHKPTCSGLTHTCPSLLETSVSETLSASAKAAYDHRLKVRSSCAASGTGSRSCLTGREDGSKTRTSASIFYALDSASLAHPVGSRIPQAVLPSRKPASENTKSRADFRKVSEIARAKAEPASRSTQFRDRGHSASLSYSSRPATDRHGIQAYLAVI